MSKIGKLPINIPSTVSVIIEGHEVSVNGPKGELKFMFRTEVKVDLENGQLKISRRSETKIAKALHGLTRSILANMVKGVVEGHQKVLELVGVGYRATKQGENLVLNVGYSHPVVIQPVNGIELETKENKIIVSGPDKVIVGEVAAKIRRIRPPEPYKGKGIKYQGEFIRRKAGKAVKAAS